MKAHIDRLQDETRWYTEPQFASHHILNRWPFYSAARNSSAYRVAKEQLFHSAAKILPTPRNVLVAPCGHCDDYPFILAAWPKTQITGLDIAPHPGVITGDILNMPFRDGEFDLIVSTLFFHHIADEGFSPYLREMRRVSKALLTMEPSQAHPLFWLTRPAKKIVGNITGQVPHEHPISLSALDRECHAAGYASVETFACSFAHNRMPRPLRPAVNLLRRFKTLSHAAWLVGLIAVSQ